MGVSCLEVGLGKVDQRLHYDRAGGAAGAGAGRVIDSAAWTVVAASDQKQLAVVVASAIEIAQPERIILLGSGARGEMVEDGGFDLLVVAGARTGEPWRAGTGRRGYAGARPSTSLSRHQRRSKPTATTHAAAFTMRCLAGGWHEFAARRADQMVPAGAADPALRQAG